MATVSTIRGPIETDRLGPTLMHEHVIWLTPGIRESWPEKFDEQTCIANAARKLNELFERGIRSLVDLTPPDAGRDLRLLQAVQEATSINIIPCTGIYVFIPAYWMFKDADDLAEAFIGD